jgi:HAD superfamily hydrolase (TIGR01509 family)
VDTGCEDHDLMEPFQAVLFDMDGVVVDTGRSVVEFWEAVAAEQGVILTEDDYARHIHGVPAVGTLRALFPGIPPDQDDAFAERVARYERGLKYVEIAGVGRLLRSLKEAGVRTALVTSGTSWKVAEVVRQLHLGGMLDGVVTAADVERGKPDPACYLAAAAKLEVAPTGCLVFEDSVSGVRSALAAGSKCVGVQSGRLADSLRAEGVRHVVPDFVAARVDRADDVVRLRLAGDLVATFTAG